MQSIKKEKSLFPANTMTSYPTPVLKRGLIIGDVQSGKTSTYIGFICKAADAGYRVFILLTGTIESLRRQKKALLELICQLTLLVENEWGLAKITSLYLLWR